MVLQGETTGPYRGPDRRGRNDGAFMPLHASRVVLVTVLVAVSASTPALFLIPRHPSVDSIGDYGAIAAALLFMIAGGLQVVAWRMTGRALYGWLASAAFVFGLLLLANDGLSNFGVGPLPHVWPEDQLTATVISAWLVWRGLADDEVNAGLAPLVPLCWSTAVGLFLMGGWNAVTANGALPGWLTGSAPMIALGVSAALVWLGVAWAGARTASRGREGLSSWGMGIVGLLAAACILRALPNPHWAPAAGTAGCLIAAAALGVGGSIARVEIIVRSRERAQRTLQIALTDSLHRAAADRQNLEEWLHDVRNAVAGLQAADAVLRDGVEGGPHHQPELADAVTAELARLHALVDPARQLRIADIDLAGAVQPVVAAARANGVDVRLQLIPSRVRADRGALARALQNVLANARLYAPRTPVTVTAVPAGTRIEISVHDGGPGIRADERAAVFERGLRGSASTGVAGNGLGLYVARTLMAAMGGEIRIDTREGGGCCVVLSVPAAPTGHADVQAPTWTSVGSGLRAAV